MAQDIMSSWVQKAKAGDTGEIVQAQPDGVLVIKRVTPENRGKAIIEIAEKLWPWLMKMFEGERDRHGMLVHPSKVRGIALNVAQSLIKEQDQK